MARFPDAFFLPVEGEEDGSQRFCLYHAPEDALRGVVLYVHPFTEEMNKSRRMVGMQSRALAQAGFGVLQIDLLGCGDSSGDFGDASWEAWVQDVLRGCAWLRAREPAAPLWVWGLRAGCLLAVEAASRLERSADGLLFWAPVPAGKNHLQQFLRMKSAAELARGGGSPGSTEALRRQIAAGEPVEVAGYALSRRLCAGMEASSLLPVPSMRVEWFELSTLVDATWSPAAAKAQEAWERAGAIVSKHLVQGPSFWQTTEIEDAPSLIDKTLQVFDAQQFQPGAGTA